LSILARTVLTGLRPSRPHVENAHRSQTSDRRGTLFSCLLSPVSCLLLLTACQQTPLETTEALASTNAAASPAAEAPAASVAPVGNVQPVPAALPDVVARVNGEAISREELERAVKSAEAQAGQVVPPQFRDQVYRSILDRLVSFHLLIQASAGRKLAVDEGEVDAEIERIRSSFPTEEAFKQRLQQWNTPMDVLRAETRKDLLIAKILDQEVLPALKVDEAGVRGFYDQHQDQFKQPMATRASHILVAMSMDAGEEEKRKARSRAEDLLSQARGGAEFAGLARQHSQDEASAQAGGDLGFIEQGQTVPAFEAALFNLKPGDLSAVVESPFGYHVIKATEPREERTLPFDEAAGDIRMFLMEQERQTLTAQFIDGLKAKANIEILM
jgi:parvulin-like peptidyl-prolyl isomerase